MELAMLMKIFRMDTIAIARTVLPEDIASIMPFVKTEEGVRMVLLVLLMRKRLKFIAIVC